MTEPRFFSLDYLERTALGDGTPIYLRLIGPDDKDALRAGFDRLSPASRYARFLGHVGDLTASMWRARASAQRVARAARPGQ